MIENLLYDLGRLNILVRVFPSIPELRKLEVEMTKLYQELKDAANVSRTGNQK